MTPEIMKMIASAQARQGDAQTLEETEREKVGRAQARAREVRAQRLARREREGRRGGEKADPGGSPGSKADWTSTYRHWEDWEDPDELAEQAAVERKKQEKAKARRGAGTACNHDHSAERAVYEMGWSARLSACRGYQTEGNMFFREGQYQRAAVRYHHAITYFEYAIPEDDAQQEELDAARLPVYLNFAACMLKLGSLDEALNYCHQALRIDPRNVKALYRKAQVFRTREKFDEARAAINEALAVVTEADNGDDSGGDASPNDDYDCGKGGEEGEAENNEGKEKRRHEAAMPGHVAEEMRAQQLLTLRVELGRIRHGVASYNRNSQRMGLAMFGGLQKKKKKKKTNAGGQIEGGGKAGRKIDDPLPRREEEKEATQGLIGSEGEAVRRGSHLPWGFVYMSDASDSDEEDRLIG